ncbi:MAG: translation elongation factor Ts [Planctomycetota bacterium]|nr:translation elongation factor Ts [Planctomycetota bacterium]
MEIEAKKVKELRDLTGLGMMDCKKALQETGGDIEKAKEWLRKQGLDKAMKKAARVTREGAIGVYQHHDGKLVAIVEVNCETDFAAKNEEFRSLCRDLAMHVAARNPAVVKREDMPAEAVEKEKEIQREALKNDPKMAGKPPEAAEKILEGRMAKFFEENVLLEQPFVKDEKRTVEETIKSYVAKIGENITVRRFQVFRVGG